MSEHTKGELAKELKAIIVDTDHAFVVRIATEPRTTDTGIANIICQGLSRPDKDCVIQIAHRLVKCWNSHDDLVAALERLFNDCRNEPAELQRQKAMQKAAEAIAKAEK